MPTTATPIDRLTRVPRTALQAFALRGARHAGVTPSRVLLPLLASALLQACSPTTPPEAPPAPASAVPAAMPLFDVEEKSVAELGAAMADGRTTAEGLVLAYQARIRALDLEGPALRAVLAQNPAALEQARALDAKRAAGQVRGPLHGIPVLLKDNIDTADPLPTTAGSLALAANLSGRDAPLVARLRDAGAVILGKTNLSAWANFRSEQSISGWSAVGGLTRNPYALDRSPCGSSSGSGVAAAASLAAVTIGTETDGSITCPAAVNGVVGHKPTVGLVSRTHIVPISASQDTAGPMGRSVADVALTLDALAGSDPADARTAEADTRRQAYAAALSTDALRGQRIGVLRFQAGFHPGTDAVFSAALAQLQAAGAELVEITERPALDGLRNLGADELTILLAEFKTGLNAYLDGAPLAVTARTLADIIAFNRDTPAEMAVFGQNLFELSEATQGVDDPAYRAALARAQPLAAQALDGLLATHRVQALVAPTSGPAWRVDFVNGDHWVGGSAGTWPAVAGYPHVTVPMGQVHGLPVGLSIIGPAWSDARLLAFAHAFEQQARARVKPTYRETVPLP
ncbi:MAG: amidase [Rubrivivax sp.]|nr:amidase [Rubrivivax sp.]